MTYGEILFLIFLGILFLTPIAAIVYYKIYDVIYEKRVAESKRRNLPYYALMAEVKKTADTYHEYRKTVAKIKSKIDKMLAELPYLVTEDRLAVERNIEYLRFDLKEQTDLRDYYSDKVKKLRLDAEALKDYLEELGEKIY